MARLPRTATTRERSSRTKHYKPPAILDAPEPKDPGTVHRWVRVAIGNEDDGKNVSMARREGWEPVRADEYPDFDAPVHHDGKFAGCIGVGDLVLCRNSADFVESRAEYYAEQTKRQLEAVDQDILKARHPAMPIHQERSTGVIHGKRAVQFDED